MHAFFTLPTTTTSTTTTTGMSDVTPVNASQALTMVEDRQDAMSAAVQANLGILDRSTLRGSP